jgi:hypothetical protein
MFLEIFLLTIDPRFFHFKRITILQLNLGFLELYLPKNSIKVLINLWHNLDLASFNLFSQLKSLANEYISPAWQIFQILHDLVTILFEYINYNQS